MNLLFFFFFSSRRRHTRCSRDWSSDVCSSDLPIFVRTVKLKDFPWNGWLRVAVPGRPRAAWNPVAGFGDAAGRMVWSAVGDPALLLDPDSGRFIANRARPQSVSEVADAPADALHPAT